MDETTRNDGTAAGPGTTDPVGEPVVREGRRGVPWGVMAVLLVVAFGAGFLWQFYAATTAREELSATEQELEVERLRIHLGQAALAAHSDDFEAARSQMSSFFTQLQEKAPHMPQEVRHVADDFLSMRDEVITGLSRSNPEYAAVLYGMVEELGTAIRRARDQEGDGVTPEGGAEVEPEPAG